MLIGAITSRVTPLHAAGADASLPHDVPRFSVPVAFPFIALLLGIAIMPLLAPKWWHRWYPSVATGLGGLVLGYFLFGLADYGRHAALHVAQEYYAFMALVGGLYIVSGGIVVDLRDRATPFRNVALLACGALLANLVGTTGASMLLIRPFLRMNRGRVAPLHVVFFIFIVSNCGGCLTPIGDPPLYLGYLQGVPFTWTITHLWPAWLLVNGALLGMFWIFDRRIPLAESSKFVFDPNNRAPLIIGWRSLGLLSLLVAAGLFDSTIGKRLGVDHLPIGPTIQIAIAATAWMLTPRSVHAANHFSIEPAKEVGLLFVGIFLTMMPVLALLQQHAASLGLSTPTHFYFASGVLSAVLDNAPTYLSFLQVELGLLGHALGPAGVDALLHDVAQASSPAASGGFLQPGTGEKLLASVSMGSVFFGAMTYIGNGPNLMVKAIAENQPEDRRVKMPSFGQYVLYSLALLLPVLLMAWFVMLK